MAQWKGLGAFVSALEAKQGNQINSDGTSSSVQSSQVASRDQPAYMLDWMKPPNTGAMAPVRPANGPFPGGFTPSPIESTQSMHANMVQASQTETKALTNRTVNNNKNDNRALAVSKAFNTGFSRILAPEHDRSALRTTPREVPTPSSAFTSTPTAVRAFTPASTPSQTFGQRGAKYSLRTLKHLDGEITEIPLELLQHFQQVARANKTNLLPFAKRIWTTNSTAETYQDGCSRRWLTHPGGEELKVGRFRYGSAHQIMFAQGLSGSQWEEEKVVVIGTASDGTSSGHWSVWRGQQPDAFGSVQCLRTSRAAIEVPEHSAAIQDHVMLRRLSGSGNSQINNFEAGPTSSGSVQTPKRGRNSGSSFDSDVPIAAQKRRRPATGNSGSGEAATTARISPELGSPAYARRPEYRTSVTTPTMSSLTKSTSQNFGGPTLIATSGRGQAPSPKAVTSEVIEIKDEVKSPSPDAPFDVDDARLLFINSQGTVVRKYPFKSCYSTVRLFRAADGANIINSDIDKLTITIIGTNEEEQLNVVRDFAEDFDEMRLLIIKMKAGEVRVARGTRQVD